MFTKKSHADVKKSTLKIQDCKKDSASRLRHLRTVLDHVDIEEAKSLFETNYSHVYYILYDTFDQAEANLRQRVHKAHREELDGSLWLLGKILCLLPELVAKRWQTHSLGRIMGKLLHHGNNVKLRREGVRFFLLWYQSLGDNAPPQVHSMFADLVPGLSIPQRGGIGLSETEYHAPDLMSHPNMLKVEACASVFHDTGAHPVRCPEISPLLLPASNERSAAPDPKDGLDVLLDCMVQACGCLKWRDNSPQKHMKCFAFLLQRFRDVYLPVFCPNFDNYTSVYDPKLDLPVMRTIQKKDEFMSACVVVLVNWISKYTHDRSRLYRLENVQVEDDVGEHTSLLSNLRIIGYSQMQLVRDVLYSTRENVNFIHEVYRQSFLLGFTSKAQIESMKTAIAVYRDWMGTMPPPFFLEPDDSNSGNETTPPRSQRLRNDSYLGAIIKENLLIRAGLQNVLQVFVTNAANVFMVPTNQLGIVFQSKSRETSTTPLDEQTDICKRVLNIYRTMVMNTRMESKTWEQLLLVLLQITSVILTQSQPNAKKNNLGGRLAQAVFQTLIVTWIRAHTNVPVHSYLWDKFLNVLSSLTHREELIVEWDKTMHTLTRVLARQVYNINLLDLPLDRLAEQKGKRRRVGNNAWSSNTQNTKEDGVSLTSVIKTSNVVGEESNQDDDFMGKQQNASHNLGSSSLNRSYSEGSLVSFRKSRGRRRTKSSSKMPSLPSNVEYSLNKIMSSTPVKLSISTETLNTSRFSQNGLVGSGTLRKALSLDSIHPIGKKGDREGSESARDSRTPSPTASSGIEGGSIKDSPMQIDMMAGDSSSIDTQDDHSVDRRSIINGGHARGWLPDVAAVMWKRMLGSLGDVNKILNPKLHAQVFKHLVDITDSLIKIRMNQGISNDNQSTPTPPTIVPPIALIAPWCYGALALDNQYKDGKIWALQLLCTIAKTGPPLSTEQLPLFYHALHQSLSGEDRAMAYTALRYLGGPRFLSLLLPGHTLLMLDLVHASTVILTSSDTQYHTPRYEVAGLLGSLLCFPRTSLPKPLLQPSAPSVDLMECPDLQEHILNVILRCARREPTSKARCVGIAALGQWIVQNLTNPMYVQKTAFKQNITHSKSGAPLTPSQTIINPRIKEAVQVLLQALQFKHRIIARVAAETLKLCSEKGKELAQIERLPQLIINAICIALEGQNISHPKESDKNVLTSLLLCLGEFCMSLPSKVFFQSRDNGDSLILNVLRTLHRVSTVSSSDRVKMYRVDEDFDMNIVVDDVKERNYTEPNYQTAETTQNCISAIRLCAKTVAMHIVTNLAHFPIGIGASRLSSMVDENDDLHMMTQFNQQSDSSSQQFQHRESFELNSPQVLTAANLQMFMLNSGSVASFIELPALKLPGGGATAGLITADRQVRVLLRDLNGKACWDASILYREPKSLFTTINARNVARIERQHFFSDKAQQHPTFSSKHPLNQTRSFMVGASLDPMISSVGMPSNQVRHTLRHRPANQLPLATDIAPDLDQLDDLLQYIGHTSPECLDLSVSSLNNAGPTPLGSQLEAQTISIILNQRAMEQEYLTRHQLQQTIVASNFAINEDTSSVDCHNSCNTETIDNGSFTKIHLPFHYCRRLFSQLGLAGWERRRRTHLLNRSDKLLRELRNLDAQRCRETHKMAVIYVGSGQEDKNSILRNSCGSGTYEMFVSALGWEIELESHNGFLGGLPRQGCGSTAPYYATPFLEVIYHVSTRMPYDSSEAVLNKTRHLGNDEVHIVWSEHHRDYRRDILPTEFCDVLITIYPLKSGLFRVTINRKQEVPWFGPLWDESVVGGACLAMLVRATAINASRAKRSSLPFYQQFYEERNRSLDTVALRHKESNTFEDFASRVFCPIQQCNITGNMSATTSVATSVNNAAPLAAALIDPHRSSVKSWQLHSATVIGRENCSQQNNQPFAAIILDHASPRTARKLHPFKAVPKKSHSAAGQKSSTTPPDSPTFPGRKMK